MSKESDVLAKEVMDMLNNSEEKISEVAAVIGIAAEVLKQANAKIELKDLLNEIGVFAVNNFAPAVKAVSTVIRADQLADVAHWSNAYNVSRNIINTGKGDGPTGQQVHDAALAITIKYIGNHKDATARLTESIENINQKKNS